MGRDTGIEWTQTILPDGTVIPGHTWNPWRGCTKISSGCKNCYMYREQKRYGNDPTKIVRAAGPTFMSPLKWDDLEAKVFTCSFSDFFLEEADDWRDDAWAIIRQTPNLTYQILTKRPENISGRLPEDWPLPNVWLGISAENQQALDSRMRIFAAVSAVVKFVSLEPLLGKVTFQKKGVVMSENMLTLLDWVIVGGESGAHPRIMQKQWAVRVREECLVSSVPFFFKQKGGPSRFDGAWGGKELDGKVYQAMPDRKLAKRRYEELLEDQEPLPEPEEDDEKESLDKGETKDILEK